MKKFPILSLIIVCININLYIANTNVAFSKEVYDEAHTLELIENLKKGDYWARKNAAEELGKSGNNEAIPHLITAVKEDSFIAPMALISLGKINAYQTLPVILDSLLNEDKSIRASATHVLKTWKIIDTLPYLIKAADDSYYLVKWNAVDALGEIGDKKAIPKLLEKIKDKNRIVRSASVKALSKMEYSNEVRSGIIEALDDVDFIIRENAIDALANFQDIENIPHFISLLNDCSYRVRTTSAIALGELGDKSVTPVLLNSLNDEFIMVRFASAMSLVILGNDRGYDFLVNHLKYGKEEPENAAEILGLLKEVRAVPLLIESLQRKNTLIQFKTILALGEIKDERAVPPLIKVFQQSNLNGRFNLRKEAAFSLGEIEDQRAFEVLLKSLKENDEEVLEGVIYALGKLGNQDAVPFLIPKLKHESSDVRWRTARALGLLKDRKSLTPLKKALLIENVDSVKLAIENAIKRINYY